MYSLGMDVGYSSVKIALTEESGKIIFSRYELHRGHIKKTVAAFMEELLSRYAPEDIPYGAVTGSGSRFLVERNVAHHVNEVTALIEGCGGMGVSFGSIAEIGGKNALYVTGLKNSSEPPEISMNSGCSAGTGSFLEEQMSRLDLHLEDYSRLVARAKTIPRIAGRCSVFAKTDIIHHQQEGIPVEDILLGLAHGLVQNYRGGVMKKLPLELPLLFVGGVSRNQGIIMALRDILRLSPENLLVPEYAHLPSALGASLLGQREKLPFSTKSVLECTEEADISLFQDYGATPLEELSRFGKKDSLGKHRSLQKEPLDSSSSASLECTLGVDVGSTSTNLVLVDRKGRILTHRYIRTLGQPVEALQQGFDELRQVFSDRLSIFGVGVTGSGRHMIGNLIGADVIKDEITAQAKAAITLDPEVDTIFEIGGQDSKFIRLRKGKVVDFQMNKICAAGTGSFIEEQAKKLDIPLKSFGDLALQGKNPVNLGDRCTVFIEASLGSHLSGETPLEDIAGGLCYSIVRNYLHRVVGQKELGEKIFFQGGLAYNQGVVNAFRSLTKKEVLVPPFFSVTGAYGAALFALEENPKISNFKGLSTNLGKIFEKSPPPEKKKPPMQGFSSREGIFLFGNEKSLKKSSRKTVGMPRGLFAFGMYPMFKVFFEELGFDLVLSNPTSEETIRKAQMHALEETCYPVKLINGHIAELVERKVDYIFFPDLYTVPHPGSPSRQNYGCPYMQLAFKMVNQTMDLEKKGIPLLSPTIAFSLGEDFMRQSFRDLGKKLGKSEGDVMEALKKSSRAFHDFEKSLEVRGTEVLRNLPKNTRAFVIISKIYGVLDPVLNLGIPELLEERGFPAIPFYDIPEVPLGEEHPNMYWPFGQHILETARFVKEHPNFYAIFLTHHGCGPDSCFSHYFREIMEEKPYLHVEVDEHASSVGVVTRVEAFLNSLSEEPVALNPREPEEIVSSMKHHKTRILEDPALLPREGVLYLPHLYPYGEIGKEALLSLGISAELCPRTTPKSLDKGRRHIMTNEYLSFTSLLGDVLQICENRKDTEGLAFLVPQSEGAEVGGQFSRLLRTKLDEEGYSRVDLLSPFLEDMLHLEKSQRDLLFRVLLAGDLIRLAPPQKRNIHLFSLLDILRKGDFCLAPLLSLAEQIRKEWKTEEPLGTLFATGELSILYNDFLNDFLLSEIEKQGYRVVYNPLSEGLWLFWRDYADQNLSSSREIRIILEEWKNELASLREALGEAGYFEENPEDLVIRAHKTLGFYAGAQGRYREAKILGLSSGIQGILALTSTYENTGISLQGLHKEFRSPGSPPVLFLSFDGHRNENDGVKIETFLHYLRNKKASGLYSEDMTRKEPSRF